MQPGEPACTGSIVAGIIDSYELTSESDYRASAESGGDYVLWSAQWNFYGDEAVALTRLNKITTDLCDNLWCQGLINWLFRVDDFCGFPVMELGAAIFTLVQIGSLEDVLISPSGEGAPYWNEEKMAYLQPDLLLSRHMAEGQLGTGSYSWQFQHNDSGLNRYMKDTIFPTLGLVADSWANSDLDLWAANLDTHEVLLGSISSEGMDWERLSQEG